MLPWLLLWLAFLPNAPYIITDLIHLRPVGYVPVWYDAGMLFASAFTGLLLGLYSLSMVRQALIAKIGLLGADFAVLGAIILSGFGIWIGRFLRWNSWDVLTRPSALMADLAENLSSRHGFIQASGTTALLSAIMLIGYGCLISSSRQMRAN
jgi:uncharacterized membrane protein